MPHYGNTLSDLIAVIQSSQTDAWLAMGEAQEAERLVSLLPEGSPERQALWAMQHVLRADAAAVSASKAAVVAYRAMLEAEAIERARRPHRPAAGHQSRARARSADIAACQHHARPGGGHPRRRRPPDRPCCRGVWHGR